MKKSIKRMTVGELGSLAEHTVEAVAKSGNASAINDATFITLKEATAQFRQAIARKKFSALTNELATATKERNQSFTGLKMQLNALKFSKDAAIAQQAEQLLVIFAAHGKGMLKHKPVKQTVYMLSLRDALKEPANLALLKSLKLDSWLVQLEAAIDKFAQIYRERGDDQQLIKTTTSATSLRPKLWNAFIDFQAFVKGRKNATSAAEWTALEETLAKLVDAAGRTNPRIIIPGPIAHVSTSAV